MARKKRPYGSSIKGKEMSKQKILELIKDVPNFPKPGIIFKDISPLLKNDFQLAIDEFENLFTPEEWKKVDYIVGIESRGFIFGAALAERLGKGLVLIRKQGKLPGDVGSIKCTLEYGEAILEMQPGLGNVVIIDDVLATGGTLTAAADLSTKIGYKVMGFGLLMNLTFLNNFRWQNIQARCILEVTS
jgi:adenine phosphoribosyltransferase